MKTNFAVNPMRPTEHLRLFVATPEKVESLKRHLMEDYLFLSDESRTDEGALATIAATMATPNSMFYEIGDWAGVVGLDHVVPGHKAHVSLKFWDTTLFRPSVVRQVQGLLSDLMDYFGLRRLWSETPDPRVVKLAKMVGFKWEGDKVDDFRWGDQFFTTAMLGMVREG
jgi:hypothetical protein